MPSPTSSLSTLRPDLSASFEEFDAEMDRNGFVGSKILPIFDVAKPSGTFGVLPVEQMLSDRGDIERAPGSGYARSKWKFETGSYQTKEYGTEEPVDDKEATMYNNYFDIEQVSAQRALDGVLRKYEVRVAAAVFNTTTWTGATLTTAVATPWSTAASATPIVNVDAAKRKVYALTGFWPNTLIVTRSAFMYLRHVAEIIDRVKYGGFTDPIPGKITAEIMAQVFDLEQVIVANSAKNSAKEGQAASMASIWDDTMAMVCKVAKTQNMREPCIGRTFHWPEDGSQFTGTTESYRDETVRGDVLRVRHEVQEKILYAGTGHLLTAVTA